MTATFEPAAPARLLGLATAEIAARVQPSVVQVRGRGRGGGSGIVWDDGATVMTNFHVVAGVGPRIEVLTADNRLYPARLIAGNPRLDLALLYVEGADLPPASLGDSTRLRVGELVFAIGNPWGQRGVVTAGIVSAVGSLPAGPDEPAASYVRSDVRLAPGNSGGPLLNARGEVVGVNAMIFGGDLSVAIPSHVAAAWVGQLPRRPVFLGLAVAPVTPARAAAASLETAGLLVAQVAPGGPAERAGLRRGDLLLALDGAPLRDTATLLKVLDRSRPGDRLRFDLLRNGAPLTLEVTLGGRVERAV
ncbi:MAG: trypsin-like peptidase domain-containing protein [Oscillochloridaceae bacterium]|nr:S1C family serine protease [Chloroflexaceae bacterium]MDW8388776.1 trypsin-like peptidase domain-containing protein [Oscillochloridaceae bacterium]